MAITSMLVVNKTDSLDVGREKLNSNLEVLRLFSNQLEVSIDNIVSEASTTAQNVSFSGVGYASDNVRDALNEVRSLALGLDAADISYNATTVSAALTSIQDTVDSIVLGGGTGDVVGPAGAVSGSLAVFSGTTGKLIADSGVSVSSFVAANSAISAGTGTKVTYDSKGLVTSSTILSSGDIPNLDASKITSGTFSTSRIPTITVSKGGTGLTSLSAGNYLRASSSTSIEQRTPVQMKSDLGFTNWQHVQYNAGWPASRPAGADVVFASGGITQPSWLAATDFWAREV